MRRNHRRHRERSAAILYLKGNSVRIGSSHPATVAIPIFVLGCGERLGRRSFPGLVPDAGVCSEQSQGPLFARPRIGQELHPMIDMTLSAGVEDAARPGLDVGFHPFAKPIRARNNEGGVGTIVAGASAGWRSRRSEATPANWSPR